MSSFDYTRSLATAQRLLARFGAERTFTRTEREDYDPELGSSEESEGTYPALTVVGSYDSDTDFELGAAPDTSSLKDKKLLYVQADAGYVPALGDLVDIDGSTYALKGISKINPAAVVVIYKVLAVQS